MASELTRGVEIETDRRLTDRHRANELPWLNTTRVRPGRAARLINWSSDGLLIETGTRLVPETTVVVQLIGSRRRVVVSGRVLRSSVVSISHVSGVRYHGAVQLDRAIDLSSA